MAHSNTFLRHNYGGMTPAAVWAQIVGDLSVRSFLGETRDEDILAEVEIFVDGELGDEGFALDLGEMPWTERERNGVVAKLMRHVRAEIEHAAIESTQV